MAQLPSTSFGPWNRGLQVGQFNGSLNAEFHLPPGKVTEAPCESTPH
jgi:hypothetical protein